MPTKPVSSADAEHYTWGGPLDRDCDAWYLLRRDGMHIIEERMPAGTSETLHHHVRARQFFYVLEGALTLEVEFHGMLVPAGSGIEIGPGQIHKAANRGTADVRFLVVSQPPSHGDRVEDGGLK